MRRSLKKMKTNEDWCDVILSKRSSVENDKSSLKPKIYNSHSQGRSVSRLLRKINSDILITAKKPSIKMERSLSQKEERKSANIDKSPIYSNSILTPINFPTKSLIEDSFKRD